MKAVAKKNASLQEYISKKKYTVNSPSIHLQVPFKINPKHIIS